MDATRKTIATAAAAVVIRPSTIVLAALLLSACAAQPSVSQPRVFAKPQPVPVVVERLVYVPAELTAPQPDPWPWSRITVGDWIKAAKAYECAYAIAAYRLQAIAALDPSRPLPAFDLTDACQPALETPDEDLVP